MNKDQIKFLLIVESLLLPITYYTLNSINFDISDISTDPRVFFSWMLIMINGAFLLIAFGGTQHPMYDCGNPENNPYLKE